MGVGDLEEHRLLDVFLVDEQIGGGPHETVHSIGRIGPGIRRERAIVNQNSVRYHFSFRIDGNVVHVFRGFECDHAFYCGPDKNVRDNFAPGRAYRIPHN